MNVKTYPKYCDAGRLTQELVSAGFILAPTQNEKLYGVVVNYIGTEWQTGILLVQEPTNQELITLDALVEVHVPTPLPEAAEFVKDTDGKLYTRSESRPLNCTTCFTTCGDIVGASPEIGAGNRLAWDASISSDWSTEGAPTGSKQKHVEIAFCDSIWIKEGTMYYMKAQKGSYIDMNVLCPHGGYYIYLGQVRQNLTGADLAVDHYLFKHPIQGDVPMGDEINTETCSQELPSYLKFKMTITVPVADVESYGYLEIELYRQRTVVIAD